MISLFLTQLFRDDLSDLPFHSTFVLMAPVCLHTFFVFWDTRLLPLCRAPPPRALMKRRDLLIKEERRGREREQEGGDEWKALPIVD